MIHCVLICSCFCIVQHLSMVHISQTWNNTLFTIRQRVKKIQRPIQVCDNETKAIKLKSILKNNRRYELTTDKGGQM